MMSLFLSAWLFAPALFLAQQPPASTGVLQGDVTTQEGTISLGGAQVVVTSGSTEVATTVSEGDGKFKIENLRTGPYTVSVKLDGFQTKSKTVIIAGGQASDLTFDLQLGSAETITVRPETPVLPSTGTLTAGDIVKTEEVEQLAPGGGLQSALRLLVSVIEVPGGLAIKGGRPNQAGTQLGSGLFVDPATGLNTVSLPDDAIDSVTVLPNPYAVEFGRFSSGLVVIQTRRATDKWKMRLNNLDPALRTKRGTPLNIIGVSSFLPRAEIGGPLVKNRLFIQHSAQYRYRTNDVPSRSQDELRKSERFSSFTRLDANLNSNHSLQAIGGVFPSKLTFATLGTFIPPDATVNTRNNVQTAAVTERALWTDRVFSETTVAFNRYTTEVRPQGTQAMEMLPDDTHGNFFNSQDRTTSTYQFVHTLSGTSNGHGGLHMYKAGVDVLHSLFDGKSTSGPVLIRRADGTLARRLDFPPTTTSQSIRSTDFAIFAQDRLQPNQRWFVELGARVDRDGVIDQFNVTPRLGSAVLLNASGSAVIRSGYGLFFERTPSTAGVFERYEGATETRYAADGVTPLGPPATFTHVVSPDLTTSRAGTWDLAYDHRFSAKWATHIGVIDRRGSHELIVEPVTTNGVSSLLLRSDGRSTYREAEFAVHFTGGPGLDLNVSYVRSQARSNLNAFTSFFDAVLAPVIGRDQFAPSRADAPHRLLTRGRMMPTPNWLFVGVLDWRTGLPYSVVDESLDFVGDRNTRRFPTYFRLDLGIEHRFKISRYRPWIGVRIDNALNSSLPSDVQANQSSPNFGSFYNSEYRQFRIQIRFQR